MRPNKDSFGRQGPSGSNRGPAAPSAAAARRLGVSLDLPASATSSPKGARTRPASIDAAPPFKSRTPLSPEPSLPSPALGTRTGGKDSDLDRMANVIQLCTGGKSLSEAIADAKQRASRSGNSGGGGMVRPGQQGSHSGIGVRDAWGGGERQGLAMLVPALNELRLNRRSYKAGGGVSPAAAGVRSSQASPGQVALPSLAG